MGIHRLRSPDGAEKRLQAGRIKGAKLFRDMYGGLGGSDLFSERNLRLLGVEQAETARLRVACQADHAIEFLRVNVRVLGIFTVAHLASLLVVACGVALLTRSDRRAAVALQPAGRRSGRHG